jgi:hypothetical protein
VQICPLGFNMERKITWNDPLALLKAVVRKEIVLAPYDLSFLDNFMLVVEILEAARKSAKTGKTIKLSK